MTASLLTRIRSAVLAALEGICAVSLWTIVALLALGGLERNVVRSSVFSNTDDVMAFLMAALFVMGLPLALARGGHVRVDLFYRMFPSRMRSWADGIFRLFGIACGLGLTAAGIALARDSYLRERMYYGIVDLPLWWMQIVVAIGALAFTLEFIVGHEQPDDEPLI